MSDKQNFHLSKQFDHQKRKFQNRRQDLVDQMWKNNLKISDIFYFLKNRSDARPKGLLPEVRPDLASFCHNSDVLKVIWFGHSTFLLNLSGKIILVDPVFSASAAPVSFVVKRFQAPVLKLSELPKVDYILISHDHYDHLDREVIKFYKDKECTFITTLGVGTHLKRWGINGRCIIEKDWWEELELDGIKFIATPAQHFSGRSLLSRNASLWSSWVLQSAKHNIYFSGDSGYDDHFKEIGEKYGPFDVAFIESGQYNVRWRQVHMLPEEGLMAFRDLNAKKYFPIHWGMFVLSFHVWNDPIEQLHQLSEGDEIEFVVPKLGEVVNLTENFTNDFWWKS